jgi:hypothetical protein
MAVSLGIHGRDHVDILPITLPLLQVSNEVSCFYASKTYPVAEHIVSEENRYLLSVTVDSVNSIYGPLCGTGNTAQDKPAMSRLDNRLQDILAVAHLRWEESLGGIGLAEKMTIGLCVQVYLPFHFVVWYQRKNRVIFAGSGEFKLTILGQTSQAIDYISMAAVYQHISQDPIEVDGYASVGIFFENAE